MVIDQHAANLSAVTASLVDGGHTGKAFAESVQTLIGAEVQAAERHELHALPSCPNAGSSNDRSLGWKSAGDFGKIPNACSIPICNSSIWLSWPCCCGDIEQALRATQGRKMLLHFLHSLLPCNSAVAEATQKKATCLRVRQIGRIADLHDIVAC